MGAEWLPAHNLSLYQDPCLFFAQEILLTLYFPFLHLEPAAPNRAPVWTFEKSRSIVPRHAPYGIVVPLRKKR